MKLLQTLLLLAVGTTFAFGAKDKGAAKLRIRTIAFRPDMEAAEAFVQDPAADDSAASTPAPIKSYLNRDEANVSLKSGKMVFTTKSDRASMKRDGETIAEVTLPAPKMKTALLLFMPPAEGSKAKSEVAVIDDSKKAFPAGSFRVTNYSDSRVKLTLQDKETIFEPKETKLITAIPVAPGTEETSAKVYEFTNNEWKVIGSYNWTRPKVTRTMIAFFRDPKTKAMSISAFDDLEPKDPEGK